MDDLARTLLDALRRRGWKLACAESATGGLLGATLTRIPGASESFRGGIISYVDAVKRDLLRVDAKLLEERGAVCEPVARQMAEGARERLGADVAVSITGIAGPNAPPGLPVGLVFVGVAARGETRAVEHRFDGDRDEVRRKSVEAALRLALDAVTRAAT